MKNTAPRQNAHLHSKNPSPACKGTGYPKGGRRDENPVLIPLDHKSLPISTVEKTAETTKKNPSPACGRTGSPKGGRRDENPVLIPLDHKSLPISTVEKIAEKTKRNPSPACGRGGGVRAFVRRTNPATTPLGEASVYPAWCVANLKFCTEKSLPPLAGEGGRRPEGGIKNQDLSRLANPATTPLGEASVYPA